MSRDWNNGISGPLGVTVFMLAVFVSAPLFARAAEESPSKTTNKLTITWTAEPAVPEGSADDYEWQDSASGTVWLLSDEEMELERKRKEAREKREEAMLQARESGVKETVKEKPDAASEVSGTVDEPVAEAPVKTAAAPSPAPPPAAPPQPQWQSAEEKKKENQPRRNMVSTAAERMKETLGLQTLSGNVTWGRQVVDLGGGNQRFEDLPASFSYSVAYQRPLSQSKNLALNITHNDQDMTVKNTATLNTSLNYTSPKYNVNYIRNITDNASYVSGGGTTENANESEQLNIAVNTFRKLPVQIGIQNTTTSSGKDSVTSSENKGSTMNISVSPAYFKKLKPVFTYNRNTSKNVMQGSENTNETTTLNLNYQVSERLAIKSVIQNAALESVPQNPAQKTESRKSMQIYGFDYKYSASLSFSSNVAFDIDDTYSAVAGDARKKKRNLVHGISWTKGIYNLRTTFTTNDTQEGTDIKDTSVTLGINPNAAIFKNANITLGNKETHSADSRPQNDNEKVSITSNFDLRPHLKLSTQYSYVKDERFGANGSPNTTNRTTTRAYRLDNPLGKTLSQNFTWQKNAQSQDTAGNVTDTFTHVVQKNWSGDFLRRALTMNLSHNLTITEAEPVGALPGQDTENRVLTFALGYQLTEPMKYNYSYSRNRNSVSSTTSPNYNYSALNKFGVNYKTAGGGTAGLNWDFSNSKNGDKANNLVFNLNVPKPDQKAYVFSLNRNKKKGDKQVNLQMGITYSF